MNLTGLGMAHQPGLEGCIGGQKFEIHWKLVKRGRPFHVNTSLEQDRLTAIHDATEVMIILAASTASLSKAAAAAGQTSE